MVFPCFLIRSSQQQKIRLGFLRALSNSSSSHKTAAGFHVWRRALQETAPPRHSLLPKGHPDGTKACTIQALLGDVFIKTAVLKEMGVSTYVSPDTILHEGDITSRVSEIVSNKVFSDHIMDILVVPGVDVSEMDLELLPTHGRGTAVESAVAMVYEEKGEEPIRALAKELIQRTKQSRNWKGILLQLGGTVQTETNDGADANGGFVATARFGDHEARSDVWPSKVAAEQDAAEEVLHQSGYVSSESLPYESPTNSFNWKGTLLEMGGKVESFPLQGGFYAEGELNGHYTKSEVFSSKKASEQACSRQVLVKSGLSLPNERVAWKQKQARDAMEASARIAEAVVDASWLKAGHDLLFEELGVNQASTNGLKDVDWFIRHATKLNTTFQALALAPVALSEHVESVHAWGARMGDQACVAVALVTTKQEARWFVGQTQPSMTKARNSVASIALCELGLIDYAQATVEKQQAERTLDSY